MKTKVGSYKGFDVYYDGQEMVFLTSVEDVDITAATELKLHELIEKYQKARGIFPVKVIDRARAKSGRITSLDPQTKRGWFVDEVGTRDKFWDTRNFYLDTDGNRGLLETIKLKQSQIKIIETEIQELKEKMTEPFLDYFNTKINASPYNITGS